MQKRKLSSDDTEPRVYTMMLVFLVAILGPCPLPITNAQDSVSPFPRRLTGRRYPATITLVDSGQELGSVSSWKVSLGDADGDGDLDAFVSNWSGEEGEYGQLWLNRGDGFFSESSQQFPASLCVMTPGDLDGDGDVDIWHGGDLATGQDEGQVWLNDGLGRFTRTDQSFLIGNNTLGDLDGDGDLDAVVVNFSVGIRVYRNDGGARFENWADYDQRSPETVVALADLDGDDDLDAYVVGCADSSFVNQPDRIWFNDGNGNLADSGQAIGANMGWDVALGDVDGDGDIDALVGNAHDAPYSSNPPAPFKLWLNDGQGFFFDSGQELGASRLGSVELADLDGDGDLDAVLFSRDDTLESEPNRVLINHGRGNFGDWGITFGGSSTAQGAVGDLDGDGDPDIFTANVGLLGDEPNRVWLNGEEPLFPVQASVVVSGRFQRCEGIAFNGAGDLYVTANAALWRVTTEGEVEWIADLYSNLGLAPIGEVDLLVADFGPTNAFDHGPNSDGIVWRITPDGVTMIVATGIGDPNFIVMQEDRSFLVSDDAVHEIWIVETNGTARLFTDSIGHPNGMVISEDGSTLYVAQIFEGISPLVWDSRIWSLPLEDGEPAGAPELLCTTGNALGPDGLAIDRLGRIYVAVNLTGEVLRIDPADRSVVVIAENLPGAASLAFGQGAFDHHALYVTSTQTGRVWKVPVGVAGAPLHR